MQLSPRKQMRFRPPLNDGMVERAGLLNGLISTRLRRLNVVMAPAGYGKTSLASQWYQRLGDIGLTTFWLTLDAEDRDHAGFLLALIEMLDQSANVDRAESDRGSLSIATLLSVLSTRLERLGGPVVVFLDDYHLCQTDANDSVIARLLARPELAHVKLVIVSRSMPHVPRSTLRLADDIRQIGIADLAFSDAETVALFGGEQARLHLADLLALNRRAEGWAVALQMVRLLVNEDGADGQAILAAFDGHNDDMGRYLSEQVFGGLPPELQRLLLDTACLPAISRELVVAVCDWDAGAAFALLRDYALPIAVLDRDGRWLRCHPVFNAYLREEADRSGRSARQVLSRAARWFEAEGDLVAAVDHAAMAGSAELVAGIIETSGGWQRVYTARRGGPGLFRRLAEMAGDIDLADYPLAALGLAVVSAKTGQLDSADHYLNLVGQAKRSPGDAVSQALRVVGVLVALYADRWVSATELSAMEADLMREHGRDLIHRGLSLNMLSYNFLIRSDLERAKHYGRLAMQTFRDGGAEFGAMHLYTHVGQAAYFSGDAATAEECYTKLIDEAVHHMGRRSDLDAMGHVLKAEVLSVRGLLDEAEHCLEWALAHVERHDAWHDLLAAGISAQQRILRLRRDAIEAHAAIDRARAVARRRGFDRLTRLVDAERVGLLIEAGEVEEAIRFAEANGLGSRMAQDSAANDLSLRLRGSVPALIWTRMHLHAGHVAKAEATFKRLETQQTQRPHALRHMELELLHIRLLLARDDREAAIGRLSDLLISQPLGEYRALVLAEGDAFCDALRSLAEGSGASELVRARLAAILGVAETRAHAPGANGLTEREESVMRLLSEGLGNKEIGRRLSLSDNTVKFHLRNIFAKLNVSTRTAAVRAARETGLIT